MTHVTVVVGAQFGSEGKGAIAGHLGRKMGHRDIAVRVAGPNAGHTAYDNQHREWKLRCIPVAAVTSPDCHLHIAAGSEIDPQVFMDELNALTEAGFKNVYDRLSIHPSATLMHPKYAAAEASVGLVGKIGSTGKGIGAARAARIMREADLAGSFYDSALLAGWEGMDWSAYDQVVIEGTQGYGLGLHTQYYPSTTSSDCRAIDFLAMAGISPWDETIIDVSVQMVARVYPIRVAGNSGPLKGETTWQQLDLPEERTTVTNKVRRVGHWDNDLVVEAIRANGGGDFNPNVQLALTMVDQVFPSVKNRTVIDDDVMEYVEQLEDQLQTDINFVGTGPETVVELS